MSFSLAVDQVAVTCYKCAVVFSVPAYFDQKRREDHQSFWCPAGHSQAYLAKSDLELAREQRDAARVEAERQRQAAVDARCDAQGQRLKAERLAKKLHRVHHGVCPECKRSLQNLRRHMATKHPHCVSRSK